MPGSAEELEAVVRRQLPALAAPVTEAVDVEAVLRRARRTVRRSRTTRALGPAFCAVAAAVVVVAATTQGEGGRARSPLAQPAPATDTRTAVLPDGQVQPNGQPHDVAIAVLLVRGRGTDGHLQWCQTNGEVLPDRAGKTRSAPVLGVDVAFCSPLDRASVWTQLTQVAGAVALPPPAAHRYAGVPVGAHGSLVMGRAPADTTTVTITEDSGKRVHATLGRDGAAGVPFAAVTSRPAAAVTATNPAGRTSTVEPRHRDDAWLRVGPGLAQPKLPPDAEESLSSSGWLLSAPGTQLATSRYRLRDGTTLWCQNTFVTLTGVEACSATSSPSAVWHEVGVGAPLRPGGASVTTATSPAVRGYAFGVAPRDTVRVLITEVGGRTSTAQYLSADTVTLYLSDLRGPVARVVAYNAAGRPTVLPEAAEAPTGGDPAQAAGTGPRS